MKRRILPLCMRMAGFLLCAGLLALHYSAPMRRVRALPGEMRVYSPSAISALPDFADLRWLSSGTEDVPVAASADERLFAVQNDAQSVVMYALFGVIPVKSVAITQTEEVVLVPGGFAVGITIRTKGVLVVGVGTVDTDSGALSPGATAGVCAGDVILSVNGTEVLHAEHLSELTDEIRGEITLTVQREGETLTLPLQPVVDSADGVRRIGLWVRDSTAGIGTTSFYDASLGWFCALGHPVSDIDTQSLLTIREGRIVKTQIVDVRPGEQGSPGELIGEFSIAEKPVGTVLVNSEYGIFGKTEQMPENPIFSALPMGFASSVHTGPAKMLATVSEEGMQAYDCEVVRVNMQENAAVKGMIIDITDERLLSVTGGIVQGM